MKKIVALALAMMLVLAVGSALAEEGSAPIGPRNTADAQSIQIKKHIKVNGDATDDTGAKTPAQTISFTVGAGTAEKAKSDANIPVITIDSATFAEGENDKPININIGSAFNSTGVYTYQITENTTTVAGMQTVESGKLVLKITVTQGTSGLELAGIALKQDGQKTDTIQNEFEAGALEVGKAVTGNMGETNKDFTVTVTFTNGTGKTVANTIEYTDDGVAKTIAPNWSGTTATATITLKDKETVKFTNIPAGITYLVSEADYTGDGYDAASYDGKESGTISKGTVASTTITNNKDLAPDTGITLESVPYIMILAVAMVGVMVIISRKRREEM